MQLGNTEAKSSSSGHAVATTGANSPVTIIEQISKVSSVLTPLLEKILETYDPIDSIPEDFGLLERTEEKIKFNDLSLYAIEIEQLAGFMSIVESSITSIESESANSSKKFLWAIQHRYQKIRKKIILDRKTEEFKKEDLIIFVQNNSDLIFQEVINDFFEEVSTKQNFEKEVIESAILLIVVYGFINCKILERP